MVGNLIHRKTDNTIIKKTNNGWQLNTHTQLEKQNNTNTQNYIKKDKQWLAT